MNDRVDTAHPVEGLPERIPAVVLLLVAICCVQAGAAFAVRLFPELGPIGTVAVRVTISAVVLLAAWRPRLSGHPPADFIAVALFGLSIAGMNLSIYEALARIPLGIAVTLEFLGPLGVAVAMSRRAWDFVWIALAGAGVALLTPLTGSRPDPLGVLFALLAGKLLGCVRDTRRPGGPTVPGGSGLALGLLAAAIVLLPAGVATAGGAILRRPALLVAGAGVALLSTIIPFSLEFEALRRLPARVYGVLVSLDPAAAVVSGLVLLGQPLTARTMAAVVLVVVAAIGATLSGSGKRSER